MHVPDIHAGTGRRGCPSFDVRHFQQTDRMLNLRSQAIDFVFFWSFCWSGSTLSGLPVQEVSPTKRQWLVSLAVCSQVPLRCVKTAFVTQGLGNRELVKNFCVPSLGHIREASARPCSQPHWSTRCLTLLMDWVMSNNPKVIRTFDACSRHSCRYREKGVPQFRCQTLSANWSYAWPPQPGHRFCVFVEDQDVEVARPSGLPVQEVLRTKR